MKPNPQYNFGSEYNKPTNEIAGVIQAYERMVHDAVARTSRALSGVVEQEKRRLAAEQAAAPSVTPLEQVSTHSRPTATEMLAQVAGMQTAATEHVANDNLLTDPTDPEALAAQQRQAIDAIHAEIAAERMSQGEYDRAA